MLLNRLSGIFFAGLGLLLYFVIIPQQTEVVDYGWMRPQTVPNACAYLLVFFGILQTAIPGGAVAVRSREILRVFLLAAIMAAALWGMMLFGYLVAIPVFAAIIMLFVGERRAGWLVGGVLLLPLAIWLIVVPLLGRTLP